MLQSNLQPPSKPFPTDEADHLISKATPPRSKRHRIHHHRPSGQPEKVFTWKNKDQAGSLSTNAPKGFITSKDAAVADPDASVGIDFRPKLRPMPARWQRTRWTTTQVAIAGSERDEHLGSPRPDHRRATRVVTTCSSHRHTDTLRPTCPHGDAEDESDPQQPLAATTTTAHRRNSAALRPRDKSARRDATPVEATVSHRLPPNSL
jgi:hypothetical protein